MCWPDVTKSMSKRVVVTGATGFIGAAIVRELLVKGDEVFVLTRENSNISRLDSVKDSVKFITCNDLAEESLILSMMGNAADVFIHCAWRGVAGAERNEAFQIVENIATTIQSIELAVKLGCRQWIGFGSQAEYGNLNCKICEDSKISPTTVYGKAKLSAGIAALGLCDAYKITGSWLRVFSTYGPGDSPHWFIPYIIQEVLAGHVPQLTQCEQLWDYLYVDDAARAVVAVAQTKASGVFNLGSGSTHPLKTYVNTIYKILGENLHPQYGAITYRPDQVMHLEADITRLVEQTGWRPSVNLWDGLTQTIAFEKARKKQ